jgi:HK97 family phage major capsid protein
MGLKHSVNRAYRQNAEWMFNDNTLLAIKKLTDSNNRPLWSPGIAAGEPDRFDGDRYVVNDDMPDMAASAKPILYGDFSNYFIRDVLGIQLLRLSERYADYLQVGFIAFSRHDGLLADAGTNPVKHLLMAAA